MLWGIINPQPSQERLFLSKPRIKICYLSPCNKRPPNFVTQSADCMRRTGPCPCSVMPGPCLRSLVDGEWLDAGWPEAGSGHWQGLGGIRAGEHGAGPFSSWLPLNLSSFYMAAGGSKIRYPGEHWEAALFLWPSLRNHIAWLLLFSVGGNGHRSHRVSGGEDIACTSQRKNLQGHIGRTHIG